MKYLLFGLLFLSSVSYANVFSSAYSNTITISVTKGDLLVVGGSDNNNTPTQTMSDSNSNAYTLVNSTGGTLNSSPVSGRVWWAVANTTNANLTLTLTGSGDLGLSVHDYTVGMDTTTPIVTSAIGLETSPTTTHTSKNMNVTASSATIYAFYAEEKESDAGVAGTGGWTIRTQQLSHCHLTLDTPFTSNGNYAATFTASNSEAYMYILVALKRTVSGGGGGTTTTYGQKWQGLKAQGLKAQ